MQRLRVSVESNICQPGGPDESCFAEAQVGSAGTAHTRVSMGNGCLLLLWRGRAENPSCSFDRLLAGAVPGGALAPLLPKV